MPLLLVTILEFDFWYDRRRALAGWLGWQVGYSSATLGSIIEEGGSPKSF